MNRTKIEWVKNPDGTPGYTWNPITGCLNHVNGMCKGGNFPCYAYKLAHGRLRSRYLANKNLAPVYAEGGELYTKANNMIGIDPFYPRYWEDKLFDPMKARKTPKGIFVCDMSDLFGIGIPDMWTDQIITTIKCCPHHRFYLLTKQPQNLPRWSPFPDNCWVGVTITNEAALLKATTNLGYIDAKVKFISFEPLLERLPLPYYQMNCDCVIIGAQTKPYKPPKWPWVEEVLEAAKKAGTPVFLKNNLGKMDMRGEWDRDLWLGKDLTFRQELPK